jgi:CRISPR/Cas system-associated exonuclease Cas4 (RecB family)
MNTLPPNFIFSQSSLQDYADCPRRFQLRYLLRCDWPAIQTQPLQAAERHMARGQAFHRLAHQRHLGLGDEVLQRAAVTADLEDWWQALVDHGPTDLPAARQAECTLAIPLAGYGLAAKYDLLAAEEGRLVIVDWKTNPRRPGRTVLEHRLQTHVYPFVASEAASGLTGLAVEPGQVEMLYWFAAFPLQPETFRYTAAHRDQDEDRLSGMIHEIASCRQEVYPLTASDRTCRYCVYRSLCERQVDAPPWDEADDDVDELPGLDTQLEQVAEIVY